MMPRNIVLGARTAYKFRHWTFGGSPYEATKRCTGRMNHMRVPPMGLSVELPMGPRNTALGA
eukprot:8605879-Pyramimonas_sp.AAC.1